MNKLMRQQLIIKIIEEKPIATQEELAQELRANGVETTQATISRDIKELRLVKVPSGSDSYIYARPQQMEGPPHFDRLQRIFQDAVVRIDNSENLIVIHTLPGAAQGVGSAIDNCGWPEVIGCVAGDDTIMVVIKPAEKVAELMRRFESMLE